MIMATHPLFQAGLVEWITSMTYQAASGAGAAQMLELVKQMACLVNTPGATASESALEVDRMLIQTQRSPALPTQGIWRATCRKPTPLDRFSDARRTNPRRVERHG